MGVHFAQKQSHMVACPDDIFENWSAIIEDAEKGKLEGKKPNPSNFRCLCGLEFEEVRSIQQKIKDGTLLISKGSADIDKLDMAEYILRRKQDNIIQDELVLEFSEANPSKELKTWEDISTFYNITKRVYRMIRKKCATWVRSKLQVGKANLEFPSDVREYIQWIVGVSKMEDIAKDLPWQIQMVSLDMEGELFLARLFSNPMPIGLCVLDSTEGSARDMQWSVERFSQLLRGILTIIGGTGSSQCVFLAFLKVADVVRLQDALQSLSCWHKMFMGAIHFVGDAPCAGAIQLFSVIVYLSKGDTFNGYSDFTSSGGPILDGAILDDKYEVVKDQDPKDYLCTKKAILTKMCINLYCMQDLMVIDVFSNGFVSKSALREKREVICLVENIKEREDLHLELISFAKEDEDIRKWANIAKDPDPAMEEPQAIVDEDPKSAAEAQASSSQSPVKRLNTQGLISKYLAKERKSK